MKVKLKETTKYESNDLNVFKESYAIVNYWDSEGTQQEKIFNGATPKIVESKVKRLADKYEIINIHQVSADLKDNQYLDSLGDGILRLDYNSNTFKESDDINNIINSVASLINNIKDSKEFPKDKNILDFKNILDRDIKRWLDANNNPDEHSTEFNNLWLEIYRYSQRGKNLITESDKFIQLASKSVPDSDGFTTDYTLYKDKVNNKYVCVFGDKDRYKPEDEDYDFETDYEDEAKEWFNEYKGFEEAEGTQVTDIAKKEDYPHFKKGKKLNEMDTWVDPRSKENGWTVKILDVIPDEKGNAVAKVELFDKDGKSCGEDTTFINRQKVKIGETYPAYIDGLMAMPRVKGVPDFTYDEIKGKGKELYESYNYFGTDTGNSRDNKSHEEHVYTLYDCFGEVDNFKTKEDAEKYIKDHKDDDLYTDPEYGCTNGPEFHIEEYDIDVMNKVIHLPDDLA